MPAWQPSDAPTRAGITALIGRPNTGKSTLLNALVGEKLSIVTRLPQTTREAVRGILTRPGVQVVFIDTPGLLEPQYLLQESMLDQAMAALGEADVVVVVLDATRPGEPPPASATARLRDRVERVVVVVNKVDVARSDALRAHTSWSTRDLGLEPLFVSALAGEGLEALVKAVIERIPESPFLYPEEDLATQPVRFFVAELVRETIFELYEQEVPYSTAVRVEEYREGTDPIYIRAHIYVERAGQKAILIGSGGATLKELGTRSRAKIEAFIGSRVYLDLWVKTLAGWRRRRSGLRQLGYPVPPKHGAND